MIKINKYKKINSVKSRGKNKDKKKSKKLKNLRNLFFNLLIKFSRHGLEEMSFIKKDMHQLNKK